MTTLKKKRMPGFKFAFSGLMHTIKTENNFRIHLIIAFVVVIAGLFFNITTVQWLFLISAIGIVLMAELFNTAIELIVNLISPDYNKKAGQIKDIAAASVFIAAITAVIMGLIIFIPYIINKI